MDTDPDVVAPARTGIRAWLDSRLRPERRELARARRSADAELLRLSPTPPRLAWRSAELTSGATRLRLARELRRLVESADARYLPSASPVDRPRIRVESDALLALAYRLDELPRPVAPRGVLLLERLLKDSYGPLYAGRRRTTLAAALEQIAAALEPAT